MDISQRASTDQLLGHPEICPDVEECRVPADTDPLLCELQKRRELEKRLLRKLDLRVAFLVLVYMIDYVSSKSPALHLKAYQGLDGQI